MDTRETYWAVLHDCKFKEYYLEAYSRYAKTVEAIISGFTMLASAGSIAAWAVWSRFPVVWSLIIMLAQAVQILRPLLPYSRRVTAAQYMLPELRIMAVQIETAWLRAESEEQATDYISLFERFRTQLISLDNKYLGMDVIPDKKRIRAHVEAETENHLRLFFGATEE